MVCQQALGKLNYALAISARNIAGGLLGGMLVLILAQVFFRHVLNDSLGWTEELAKFSMVWVAFLVSPWAYREHLNVSIDLFSESLPVSMRLLTEIIITLLILTVSAIFFWQSIGFFAGGWSIQASSMPIPMAYFYACAPFAFVAIFLVGIEKLLEQLTGQTHVLPNNKKQES